MIILCYNTKMSLTESAQIYKPKTGVTFVESGEPSRTIIETEARCILPEATAAELRTILDEHLRLQAVIAELAINDYSKSLQ